MSKVKQTQIIGMVHLKSLDSSINDNYFNEVINSALEDIQALQRGGVDSIMIENDGDSKYSEFLDIFHATFFAKVISEVSKNITVPFGLTVLLNDWRTGFSLSKLFGGKFIRLDTFVDDVVRISDGIEIRPNPENIMRFRKSILAQDVKVYTDVHVKHTKLIKEKSLEQSINQAINNGTDGIIITGEWTGKPPTVEKVKEAKDIIGGRCELIIGSGISADNIGSFSQYADKIIVGSSIKLEGKVDKTLVKTLISRSKNL